MPLRHIQRTVRDAGAVERLRYARALGLGTRLGLLALVAGFLAYAAGWPEVRVGLHESPRLWALAASDYLHATGMHGAWGWLAALGAGDALPLLGIAALAAVPFGALLALIPHYARRRDWIYLSITALQIAVLALAASGVLVAGH